MIPNRPAKPAEDDLPDDLFNKFREYVYQQARISLGENKRELIRARFGKTIRQRHMSGFQEYYNWIINDKTGEASREVMNAISTNLTSFFRENQHFEFLGKTLLPRLASQPRLRAWSAGCSTGEEVYTIAITILESLPGAERMDIKLLATDVDTEVVAHGARGVYGQDRVRDVPAAIVKQYFDRAPDDNRGRPQVRLKDAVRRLVTFRHLNLFGTWPFKGKFDFIFCRNVMIYFDRETQEMLVNRFYEQLVAGGHLFIGHSEGLSNVKHNFEYVQPTIYRRAH